MATRGVRPQILCSTTPHPMWEQVRTDQIERPAPKTPPRSRWPVRLLVQESTSCSGWQRSARADCLPGRGSLRDMHSLPSRADRVLNARPNADATVALAMPRQSVGRQQCAR